MLREEQEGGRKAHTAEGTGHPRRRGRCWEAHLQVPVYNVFLVAVVHSRHDLEGGGGRRGGEVSYLWLPNPSASLRDAMNPPLN